ncbi:MAG: cell wall hydrolase [Firmicutes bacterium]|nr:cell wall hydrolase [Bacillota bacterium]
MRAGFFLLLLLVGFSWTSYAADYQYHTVVKGDTLYSLAKAYGSTVEEIIALNDLPDYTIKVGDILKLPAPKEEREPGLSVATVSVGLSLPAPKVERPVFEAEKPTPEVQEAVARKDSRKDSQPVVKLTPEEVELLSKLVHAEARGEPLEGQIAVAAVVLNRVKHPSFPNTVKEVIFEPGQFLSVENGMINQEPSESCRKAVEYALQGQDPSGGALFFYNPKKSKALAWWQTRKTTAVIGDHNFAI